VAEFLVAGLGLDQELRRADVAISVQGKRQVDVQHIPKPGARVAESHVAPKSLSVPGSLLPITPCPQVWPTSPKIAAPKLGRIHSLLRRSLL